MKETGFALLGALGLAACGHGGDESGGKAMVVHSKGGDVTVSTAQAPANLPAYAPIFAGAKLSSSITSGTGGIVTFDTAEKPATVMAFYEKLAAANKLTSTVNLPADTNGSHYEIFSQPGTQRSLNVAVSPSESGTGTTVGLTYGAP